MKIDSYLMLCDFAERRWGALLQRFADYYSLPELSLSDCTVCEDRDHVPEIQVYFRGCSYEWHQHLGFRILNYIAGAEPEHSIIIFTKSADAAGAAH